MKNSLNNYNKETCLFYISMFLLLFMFTLLYNSVDMDYWARLLQGNAFLSSGHILKIDPFSYTSTHVWLDHEWGASVVFALIQKSGYISVLCFKSILVFFIFFLIFKTIKIHSEHTNKFLDITYFICAVFAMPTITQSWIRCHFFTFLFFVLSLYILEKVRKSNNFKLLVFLPVLMLFWTNIHGGCVALLGLLLIYSIGEYLNKKNCRFYIITLIMCFAVMFINPYGLDYVKFIFMASTMARPFVTEWISPFFHPFPEFMLGFKLFYLVNLFVLFFLFKNLKKDYTSLILLIVCAYLSCRYVKNTPFFIITSMIFLYKYFLVFFEKFLNKFKKHYENVLIVLCLIIIFISLVLVKNNIYKLYYPDLSQQPVNVVEFIKINNLKGNILAPFDMGSYIAYKLYPDNLIYMDGRYEEVYYKKTKELLDDFYNVTKNWDCILNSEFKHDYIIVPQDALLNDYLINNTEYKLIYSDSDNCLYSVIDKIKSFYILPNAKDGFSSHIDAFSSNVNFK